MKRVLLGFLLVSTIMSSVAWAWGSHGSHTDGAFGSVDNIALSVDESNPPADDHETFHEHYCSHGWAHLLGFPTEALPLFAINCDNLFFDYEPTIVSQITPPPSKPPRV